MILRKSSIGNRVIMKENPYFTFLLDVIKNIQDKDYQERIWLRAEGPECSDFGDTINDFFDFYEELGDLENTYEEYGIDASQYRLLHKLYQHLQEYCDIIPISPKDEDVLADPRWQKIRNLAKKVYAGLILKR